MMNIWVQENTLYFFGMPPWNVVQINGLTISILAQLLACLTKIQTMA